MTDPHPISTPLTRREMLEKTIALYEDLLHEG
jgi:hypothetical protein